MNTSSLRKITAILFIVILSIPLRAQLCSFSVSQEGRMRFISASELGVLTKPAYCPELQMHFALKEKSLRAATGIGYTMWRYDYTNYQGLPADIYTYKRSKTNYITVPLFLEFGHIGANDNPGLGFQAGMRFNYSLSEKLMTYTEKEGGSQIETVNSSNTDKNLVPEFFIKSGLAVGLSDKLAMGVYLGYHLNSDRFATVIEPTRQMTQSVSATFVFMMKKGKW